MNIYTFPCSLRPLLLSLWTYVSILTVFHFRFSFSFSPHILLRRRKLFQTEINLFVLSSFTMPESKFCSPIFFIFSLLVVGLVLCSDCENFCIVLSLIFAVVSKAVFVRIPAAGGKLRMAHGSHIPLRITWFLCAAEPWLPCGFVPKKWQ
ncbi:hypothetical protein B0J17DRAFT_88779 [Rhizoctonia solani]|nr:hypothetical protein B0J17DRAFT_88779 [Rhizoctonia solani]